MCVAPVVYLRTSVRRVVRVDIGSLSDLVKYDKLVFLSQARETCLPTLFRVFLGGNVPSVPSVTFRYWAVGQW